jgi:hypothetical protein
MVFKIAFAVLANLCQCEQLQVTLPGTSAYGESSNVEISPVTGIESKYLSVTGGFTTCFLLKITAGGSTVTLRLHSFPVRLIQEVPTGLAS